MNLALAWRGAKNMFIALPRSGLWLAVVVCQFQERKSSFTNFWWSVGGSRCKICSHEPSDERTPEKSQVCTRLNMRSLISVLSGPVGICALPSTRMSPGLLFASTKMATIDSSSVLKSCISIVEQRVTSLPVSANCQLISWARTRTR